MNRAVLNRLAERLARRIRAAGPITVADYMAAALGDPEDGYYRQAEPLGQAGDFTTAPEISQVFGELIGAWLADCWEKTGRADPVQLIELGPGRGTLMADALRATARVPGWHAALRLHLVEINPRFRQAQAERLARFRPQWHESLATVPDGPLLLVANEFFDALPVRQLVREAGAWRERLIDWSEPDGFRFVTARTPSPLGMLIPDAVRDAADGAVYELSPASLGVAAELARRIGSQGCAALVIDYGRAVSVPEPSLQAVRAHRMVDVLDEPGRADLSAHVDFAMLARAARDAGAATQGPVAQGEFLARMGLALRVERLKRAASADQVRALDDAVARLAGATAMGELFKVLAITEPGLSPSGFAAEDSDYA